MWLSDEVVTHLRDVASWPDLAGGRYTIVGPLGRGGMGRVFVARDERLNRDVAIKISNAPAAGSALDDRLQREALVLADLEHPGIVPVHDAGLLEDDRRFYVMKLVHGETLESHAASLAGESARLAIFERVAEPVAFAHARGIVHRDLKPSNIMVGSFGEVLVLDWGLAKVLGAPDQQAGSSVPGTRMGTPGFMAPEQAQGRVSEVSPAADVYALGALLLWMLGIGGAPIPRRLRAIAEKCLAERPADRYPDAAHVVADLARYRAGLAVHACPETVWDKAGRWLAKYRTFILLIAAYLAMRAVLAWLR
jgi:serine/threonine protein kinase